MPKHDETDVAQRRIGNQTFNIWLNEREQRAIDDSDDRANRNPGRKTVRGAGSQGDAEAQQTIGSHLRHDGRQQECCRHGRFRISVGQPGVQRENRRLYGEGRQQSEEDEHLVARTEGNLARRDRFEMST